MSRCRVCRRCGSLDVYNLGGGPQVIRAGCLSCDRVTHLRPICDDWSGSWVLDGEDEEVVEESDPGESQSSTRSSKSRPSVSISLTDEREDDSDPSVADSFDGSPDEDTGPWCPRCEGDVEDDEVGEREAYWCPVCESLYPSDEVLTPENPRATNHGGDSVATDGSGEEDVDDVDVVDPNQEDPDEGLWRWSE